MSAIPLAIEYNVSRAPQLSNSRVLNFMVEKQEQEAEGQAPLFGCPGADTFASAGSGPHRGSWNFNEVPYFVSGTSLYRMGADGSTVLVATGIDGTGPVDMSDNGVQMCIVNGFNGWIYTVAGGLVQITDSAFYAANTVTFMDGYFIFDRVGTNEWFLSTLYDGLTYNGTDSASAEGQPGYVTAIAQNLQLVYVICTAHIELWYDSGNADFPFDRYTGGIIPYGCVSPYTILKQDGALFFLGTDRVFYRLQANACTRVSTHALETALEKAGTLTDAFCFTYTWEGHKIITLTVPDLNHTFEFDISTGKWHERNSVDPLFNSLGAWRAGTAIRAYNKIFLGDTLSGQIGRLDWTIYTEFGNPMLGLIHTANLNFDRKRVYCSLFELNVQAGVGLTTGQGSDPQIMLRKSVDGGETWGLPQKWRSMGKVGKTLQRLRWMGQGQGRQMMWELVITDPVPRTIIAANGNVSAGM